MDVRVYERLLLSSLSSIYRLALVFILDNQIYEAKGN